MTEMPVMEIRSYIETIEQDTVLYEEKNFDKRVEVIDFIEFQIIDQLETLLPKTMQVDELSLLKHRAEKLKSKLEATDSRLFQSLREKIRQEGCAGGKFIKLVNEYLDLSLDDSERYEEPAYDKLDIFVNGLCFHSPVPEQTKELELEMVYYQKTPARIVFELVERTHLAKDDVFVDLGSGLGQVAILVNLLTGITSIGIEFETAFCNYSRDCAAELNLSQVRFINVDVRKADYTTGTVFFMFTPFKGNIMQDVLEMLRKESMQRKIRIITYGPCAAQVSRQNWLQNADTGNDNIYRPVVFMSC